MIQKVDHIALAVKNIDASISYFLDELGLKLIDDEIIHDVGVRLAYLDCGNTMIQLVQPLSDGPLKKFLEEKGEGLHHICFAVEDIPVALKKLNGEETTKFFEGGRNRICSNLQTEPSGLKIELTEHNEITNKYDVNK
jgi:methylmalonyl-CoA/ethylmalonyl-CoA epimerase